MEMEDSLVQERLDAWYANQCLGHDALATFWAAANGPAVVVSASPGQHSKYPQLGPEILRPKTHVEVHQLQSLLDSFELSYLTCRRYCDLWEQPCGGAAPITGGMF